MPAGETYQAIEATFRIERARLIAGLARIVRNVDLAEELAQDALVVALAEWPKTGVPDNPGAWLMAVAKRRAIDAFRRDKMRERKHEEMARTLPGYDNVTRDGAAESIEAAIDDDLGDELLGLICGNAHLSSHVRTPATAPTESCLCGARRSNDVRVSQWRRRRGGLSVHENARSDAQGTVSRRVVSRPRT